MQIVDIVILLLLILGLYAGYRQGFIVQLTSLIGLIIGFFVARNYATDLSILYLRPLIDSNKVADIATFCLIWLVCIILVGAIGNLFSGLLDKISLGWLNRFIGAIIGCIKYLFLVSLVIGIYDSIDSDSRVLSEENKDQSLLYKPVKSVASNLIVLIKEDTTDWKKKINDIDFNI